MISHCPKCRELVTLPAVHVSGARVVCPHCEEVSALDDVARQSALSPPEMKLVVEEVTKSFASEHIVAEQIMPDDLSDSVVHLPSASEDEEVPQRDVMEDLATEEETDDLDVEELSFDFVDDQSLDDGLNAENGENFAEEEAAVDFDTPADLANQILTGDETSSDEGDEAAENGASDAAADADDSDADTIDSWLSEGEDAPLGVLPKENVTGNHLEAEPFDDVQEPESDSALVDEAPVDDTMFEGSVEFENLEEMSGDEEAHEESVNERSAPEESSPDQTPILPAADFIVKPPPRKSRFGAVAKLAVGSLVGCLVAQLVLWWLPGSLKRDPLGLAKALPGFASFLAPAELRQDRTVTLRPSLPRPAMEEADLPEDEARTDLDIAEVPPPPEQPHRAPQEGAPDEGQRGDADATEGERNIDDIPMGGIPMGGISTSPDVAGSEDHFADDAALETDPAASDLALDSSNDDSMEDITDPLAVDGEPDESSDMADTNRAGPWDSVFEDDATAPADQLTNRPSAPLEAQQRIVNAPRVTPDDLNHSLMKARTARERLANATESEARGAMIGYYVALCELGKSVALVTHEPETVEAIDEIAQFMESSREDRQTAAVVLRSAAPWFKQPTVRQKFNTEGIAIHGQVQRVEKVGDLTLAYVSQPRTQSAEVIIPVIVDPMLDTADPSPLVEGAQVFLLGTVVADAANAIKDFPTIEPTVVWSGYAVEAGL